MKRLEISPGDVFGMFRVIEEGEPENRKAVNSRGNRLLYYLTECTNCGFRHHKTGTDLTRSSRGKGVKDFQFMVCRRCKGLPAGTAGMNELLAMYKRNAAEKGREFCLTVEEFKELTSAHCHYCGRLPASISRGWKHAETEWGKYIYNGIDRKDNDIGYVPDNCVPCCEICNRAKIDRKYDEYINYISEMAMNAKNDKIPCLTKTLH